MGLDDIHLSVSSCKTLFPNGLVYGKELTTETEEKIHFKGKNLKSCLVLTDSRKSPDSEESEFIRKLLSACKLGDDDIALINLSEQTIPVSKIISGLKIKTAILFGIANSAIDLPIPDNEDTVIDTGECKVIKTLPVSGLLHSTSRKKLLWSGLRELFNL